jgi:hypothetical protein
MKPLTKSALTDFLERFEYFKEGEFRNIEINSPTNITFSFAVQDSSRGYDWVTIKLEFDNISEASLLENSDLSYVDMSDGVDIKNSGTEFAFKVNNSTCQIKSSNLKYEEGRF